MDKSKCRCRLWAPHWPVAQHQAFTTTSVGAQLCSSGQQGAVKGATVMQGHMGTWAMPGLPIHALCTTRACRCFV